MEQKQQLSVKTTCCSKLQQEESKRNDRTNMLVVM